MKRRLILLGCGGLALIAVSAFMFSNSRTEAAVSETIVSVPEPVDFERGLEVQILVDGRPLEEYAAHGKTYIEAIAGAEYEVRIRNPLPYRVAVALSVDGLNSIDARHSSAWNASKWVIEPYGTINISGWQMSSERARRFYFTSERDSYGAKLGQTPTSETFRPYSSASDARTPSPLHPDRLRAHTRSIKTTDAITKGPNHLQPEAANLRRTDPNPAASRLRILSDRDNRRRLSRCPTTSMRRLGLGGSFTMMFAG